MDHILATHEIVKTDFVRGENCRLFDSHGRRFLDFESGIWSTSLGHGHPRVNAALRAQLDRIAHLGTRYPSPLAEAAAIAVLGILGMDDGKCLFLSSGSEAVEFAVQAARRVSGRPRLLTFRNSYLAAYGSAGRKPADEWLLIDPDDLGPDGPDARLSAIPFDDIGAFVFEPGGSGSAFVRFPPPELVAEIASRVRRTGGLLVSNEVTTGMGRTGRWFGFEHFNLAPDIVTLGKGLGNGYPVSAVAMRPGPAAALEASGLVHAQSHQNDPLGCAVALAVIETMREDGLVARGAEVGATLLAGLRDLQARHPIVKEARGRGMLLGLELQPDERLTAAAAYRRLLDEGCLVGYHAGGNLLRFDPALTIEREDLDILLDRLDAILTAAEASAR